MFEEIYTAITKSLNEASTRVRRNSILMTDQQRLIKSREKVSTDLPFSLWAGGKEDAYRKFLILNDGSVIPVVAWHNATIAGADWEELKNARFASPGGMATEEYYKFKESGGITGRIHKNGSMSIWSQGTLNPNQVKSTIDLVTKYHVGSISFEITGGYGTFNTDDLKLVKLALEEGPEFARQPVPESVDQLIRSNLHEAMKSKPIEQISREIYQILECWDHHRKFGDIIRSKCRKSNRLGRYINESALPVIQRQIKRNSKPSLTIPLSRWEWEEPHRKFLILNDGSVIPVESTHMETIHTCIKGDSSRAGIEFEESGGVQGSIDRDTILIYEPHLSRLTKQQIDSIVQLFTHYSLKTLDYNLYPERDLHFSPKSAEYLRMVLEEGSEFAEEPVYEAGGHWRNWDVVSCRDCGSKVYVKDFNKNKKPIPAKCMKCGSNTEIETTQDYMLYKREGDSWIPYVNPKYEIKEATGGDSGTVGFVFPDGKSVEFPTRIEHNDYMGDHPEIDWSGVIEFRVYNARQWVGNRNYAVVRFNGVFTTAQAEVINRLVVKSKYNPEYLTVFNFENGDYMTFEPIRIGWEGVARRDLDLNRKLVSKSKIRESNSKPAYDPSDLTNDEYDMLDEWVLDPSYILELEQSGGANYPLIKYNTWKRGGHPLEVFYSALIKFEPTKATVYRGTELSNDMIESIKVGEVFELERTCSYSLEKGVALQFRQMRDKPVLIELKAKSARPIYHEYDADERFGEKEVVIMRGTKIKLKSKSRESGVVVLHMEEV